MDWLWPAARDREAAGRPAPSPGRDRDVRPFLLLGGGPCCELAAFGYSRDGKRGPRQVEYGLLTDRQGRPVAVEVFPGNTSDPESFKTAITRVRATSASRT